MSSGALQLNPNPAFPAAFKAKESSALSRGSQGCCCNSPSIGSQPRSSSQSHDDKSLKGLPPGAQPTSLRYSHLPPSCSSKQLFPGAHGLTLAGRYISQPPTGLVPGTHPTWLSLPGPGFPDLPGQMDLYYRWYTFLDH